MLHLLGNIRQARVSAKLSQAEMADILGVSQQVYSNIEAGKVKKVSAEVAKKFQDWAVTNNLVEEPALTYRQSRHESKLNGNREDVPVYNGSTTLGHTTEATTRAYVLPLANDGISKKVSEFYSKIKR